MPIDLHTHSTASDGTLSPAELMAAAAQAGLDVIALTDHDTTDGWQNAGDALPEGLSLVRGVELSCRHEGISLHLLGYLFDPTDAQLAQAMEALRASRTGRAEAMVAALAADGVAVTWDQVDEIAGGVVGRPHIGHALIAAGVVGSLEEAFTSDWIGTGGRYWVARHELDAVQAVRLVRAAGGVTVFAHPAAAARGRIVGDDVIALLADAGLVGLEVAHPDHPPATQAHLAALAADLGLLVTGASDFHGSYKPVRLGAHQTEPAAFEALVSHASGVPVLHGPSAG